MHDISCQAKCVQPAPENAVAYRGKRGSQAIDASVGHHHHAFSWSTITVGQRLVLMSLEKDPADLASEDLDRLLLLCSTMRHCVYQISSFGLIVASETYITLHERLSCLNGHQQNCS